MSEKRRALGRGLGALIPTSPGTARPVDVFFRESTPTITLEPDHDSNGHERDQRGEHHHDDGHHPEPDDDQKRDAPDQDEARDAHSGDGSRHDGRRRVRPPGR